MKTPSNNLLQQARIKTSTDLGQYLRAYRKSKGITLETVSGLSNVSIKFLSEFERGKDTAEIGKVLKVLNAIGLEIVIQPRGIHVTTGFDIPIAHESAENIARKKDENKI